MSYLPKIVQISDELIKALVEDDFFTDFEIKDQTYAKKRFCDELTRKFIDGKLDLDDEELFSDNEMDSILREIVAENVLRDLQKSGFISSYEDDNTEETFFLTERGKEELNNMKDVEDVNALKIFLNDDEKN